MPKKFLRSDSMRHSRLGKNRPKLQKWRKPRGRHSKIRRNRFGYPSSPNFGYGSPKINAGKVQGLKPVLVHNLKELETVGKDSIVIVARVGARKKLEIIKKAQERQIKIGNIRRLK